MWLFRRRKREAIKPAMAIVGLGNPGPEYVQSRHNVGFMCVDHFAETNHIPWSGRKGALVWGEGQIPIAGAQTQVLLARPRTFMNQSGEAVRYLMSRWHVDLHDLLVIYDEMDLPLGTIRIRQKGSSGGHKGIQSIIDALGTEEIPRIRVGIGRSEGNQGDAVTYVLEDFTEEEKKVVEGIVATVAEAISCALSDGTAAAMNRFN